MEVNEFKEIEIYPDELNIEFTRGRGPGGQHRNTTDSTVVITHISTGIKVVRNGRCQHKNKEEGLVEMKKRVNDFYRSGQDNAVSEERREQIGDGARGDKRRTYRVKDGVVTDHVTGKTATIKEIFKGKIELLAK